MKKKSSTLETKGPFLVLRDGTHFLFKGVLNAKKEIIKSLVNLKFLNEFCLFVSRLEETNHP